jgi:hypothetical protein
MVTFAGGLRRSGLRCGQGHRRPMRLRMGWLLGSVVVVVAVLLAASVPALAEDCSLGDLGYNAACGPEYESPGWGDAAGWTDPSQYSTIQLADVTGDGQDELIARNSDGLEIWRFDKSIGEWRPAVGADGHPEVLTDFRSPLPDEPADSHGTNPMVYSTIQAARVVGNGSESVVAQFPDGTHTYDYAAPAGSKSIQGGKWLQEPVGGPKGDLSPSQYLNLRVIGVQPEVSSATVVMENQYWTYTGNGTPGGGGLAPGYQPFSNSSITWNPGVSYPKYYLNNLAAEWPVPGPGGPHLVPANVYRTAYGVQFQTWDPAQVICQYYQNKSGSQCGSYEYGLPSYWEGDSEDRNVVGPFPEVDSTQFDCSAENFSCFGTDPSWYETMQVANGLRGPGDKDGYVLGRLSDGLHVYAYDGTRWDTSLPVLTALKDSPSSSPPAGTWSSIRTGDVTGDGNTDVLALVNGQIQAWELKPNGSGGWAWSQLPADVPLNLGPTWETNASYYSTIQVGPIAGPGNPDGVTARGPFGVRTWFYCSGGASRVPACSSLQGKSGWTSWLAQPIRQTQTHPAVAAYPTFSGGQAAAWTALNTLAHNPSKPLIAPDEATIRGVWTGSDPPSDDQLNTLISGIALAAGCSSANETSTDPPSYSTCTPPSGSSGFTASDWTAVVDQTLADAYYARVVVDYYGTLGNLRRDIFLAEGAALPAIGSTVQGLAPAAGNSSLVSPQSVFSTIFGIAGSLAGAVASENPAIGAGLSVASYVIAMIPSATPVATSPPFSGTFGDLQNKFAAAVGQADKAQEEQSYEVRLNWSLLRLVGQLTDTTGAWHTVDGVGLKSATEEGYVLSAYKQLLPTVYDRYVITNCQAGSDPDCNIHGWRGTVGSLPNLTTLDYPPNTSSPWHWQWTPCYTGLTPGCQYYNPPPDSIANQVWGPVSDTCDYNGDPATAWTYGDPTQGTTGCNLGIDPLKSVDYAGGNANGWNFTTCWASPLSYQGTCSAAPSAATAGPNGSVRLTLSATLPRGYQVRGATLPANRVLSEPRGAGNLLSAGPPKGKTAVAARVGLGTIHLTSAKGQTHGGSGRLLLSQARSGPSASLSLKTKAVGFPSTRVTTMHLQLSGLQVAVPRRCEQLPASVALSSPTFTLNTTVKVSDGHKTMTISRPTQWRCMRNRRGEVTALRTVTPQTVAHRPGLSVALAGPRAVVAGSQATFTVRLHNTRRRTRNRYVSSLWDIRTRAGLIPRGLLVSRRVKELRRGKQKTLRIRISVPARLPRGMHHRVCVAVTATAASARPASARACAAVGALPIGRG